MSTKYLHEFHILKSQRNIVKQMKAARRDVKVEQETSPFLTNQE